MAAVWFFIIVIGFKGQGSSIVISSWVVLVATLDTFGSWLVMSFKQEGVHHCQYFDLWCMGGGTNHGAHLPRPNIVPFSALLDMPDAGEHVLPSNIVGADVAPVRNTHVSNVLVYHALALVFYICTLFPRTAGTAARHSRVTCWPVDLERNG
jgi:hypothetical protein